MNTVQISGRLTADPELRHTQSGLAMTRFSVAVDRRVKQGEENQADFINVIAWRQTAEFICKYFTKGQRIALTGRIQTGSYTDSEGKKRSTFDVIAENVEFCDSKNSQKTDTKSIEVENTADFEQMPDDKDLPF